MSPTYSIIDCMTFSQPCMPDPLGNSLERQCQAQSKRVEVHTKIAAQYIDPSQVFGCLGLWIRKSMTKIVFRIPSAAHL